MRVCSAWGCNDSHYGNGWCRTHYLRMLRYNSLDAPVKEIRTCKVEECNSHCGPSGLCKHHYFKIKRGKEITPQKDHEHHIKYRYGITLNQYNLALWLQDDKCAICKQPETRIVNGKVCKLSVDHCHKTRKLRKLLCFRCNSVLGKLGDSVELLDAMKDYLNAFESGYSPRHDNIEPQGSGGTWSRPNSIK